MLGSECHHAHDEFRAAAIDPRAWPPRQTGRNTRAPDPSRDRAGAHRGPGRADHQPHHTRGRHRAARLLRPLQERRRGAANRGDAGHRGDAREGRRRCAAGHSSASASRRVCLEHRCNARGVRGRAQAFMSEPAFAELLLRYRRDTSPLGATMRRVVERMRADIAEDMWRNVKPPASAKNIARSSRSGPIRSSRCSSPAPKRCSTVATPTGRSCSTRSRAARSRSCAPTCARSKPRATPPRRPTPQARAQARLNRPGPRTRRAHVVHVPLFPRNFLAAL